MDFEQATAAAEALDAMKKSIKKGGVAEERLNVLEDAFRPIIDREFKKQVERENNVRTDYLDYNPVKEVSKAVHCLTNGPAYYLTAVDEVRRRDNETQDYLHLLELTEMTEDELKEHGRLAAQIRRDRRTAKDFSELVKPLVDYANRNQKVFAELKKIHADMIKKEKNMKLRCYTPKEKTDFEIAFERAHQKGVSNE